MFVDIFRLQSKCRLTFQNSKLNAVYDVCLFVFFKQQLNGTVLFKMLLVLGNSDKCSVIPKGGSYQAFFKDESFDIVTVIPWTYQIYFKTRVLCIQNIPQKIQSLHNVYFLLILLFCICIILWTFIPSVHQQLNLLL